MIMMLILVNLGLAFIFGIYLSFNFFFNRFKIGNPWRWLGGIVGGLFVGTLMVNIDFWIIWPPTNVLTLVVGFALMLLIAKTLIGYPEYGKRNVL